jgi:putative ABC transport system permease protein
MTFTQAAHLTQLGLKNITLHRLRSSLTVLGIVLGVASVIIMLAVGEAARFQAIQQIQQLGATNIILRSTRPPDDPRKREANRLLLKYGLTQADLRRISDTVPTVVSATPMREFRKEFRFLDRKLEGRLVAVTPDYLAMNGLELSRGRFIQEYDDNAYANVAVLGAETAAKLFPIEDPLGRSIRINDHFYRIIGVTGWRADSAGVGSSLSAQTFNKDVYIPFRTDQIRNGKININFRAGSLEAEELEITQITVALRSMDQVKATAEVLRGLIVRFHPEPDVAITVPLDLLEKAEQTQRLFTLVLGAIASISLLVGGIGIMNIMLATVTERTREIGIRRALGAKRIDITFQFLVETMVLSSVGGLLGVVLGVAASFAINHFFKFPTIIQLWSPLLALAVSMAVGLLFGIYPARRAAQMDPIEALRHE